MKRIAVFASGYGSNFQKIHENIKYGLMDATLTLFVSDQKDARAVVYAKDHNITCFVFDANAYHRKSDYEEEILHLLKRHHVDLIVLAGYMRKIGPTLLKAYPKRILNIHPSYLPAFKGKDAILQAFDSGVEQTGVTVHYVDENLDSGEIILQEKVDIKGQSLENLTAEIHRVEHRLYTLAIQKVLEEMIA